ncbi:MAG: hypothetical protein ABSE77_16670 [Acidimicrobiales bacterium]|jgi:hypothetical protein
MKKFAGSFNRAARPALVVSTLAAVSLVAAAWGGSPAAAKAPATANSPTAVESVAAKTKTTPAPAPGPSSFAPAASGTIATILGQDLEVQGTSGQTTVELTAKTTITATVAVSLKDITAGTCISATGTKGKDGTVDATLVTVSQPVKGSCLERGGFGGGGGFGSRGGSGGSSPTRTSGTVPARFKTPANVAGAFGKVTSVSGSTIKIQGISFAGFGGRPSGTSTSRPTTTPKTSSQTVVVSSKTTYSKTERITSGALKVGECATAIGSTNDIGVVTATRLTITQPVGGSCSTGFGFRGGSSAGAPS